MTPASVNQTVTVIDVGGASTQIAFAPRSQELTKEQNIQILLKGFNFYDLYAVSYLGYGNDQARQQVTSKYGTRDSNGTHNFVNSPCFFSGYEDWWEMDHTILLRGTGDPAQCIQQIRDYLNASKCTYPKVENCGLNNTYQADIPYTAPIYAQATVSIAAQFFHLDTREYLLSELRDKYIELCQLTWEQAKQTSQSDYLWSMCFLGLYSQSLLIDGYKIAANKYINSPTKINEITPSWALGGMIYSVSQLYCYQDSPFCVMIKKFFEQKSIKEPVSVIEEVKARN